MPAPAQNKYFRVIHRMGGGVSLLRQAHAGSAEGGVTAVRFVIDVSLIEKKKKRIPGTYFGRNVLRTPLSL